MNDSKEEEFARDRDPFAGHRTYRADLESVHEGATFAHFDAATSLRATTEFERCCDFANYRDAQLSGRAADPHERNLDAPPLHAFDVAGLFASNSAGNAAGEFGDRVGEFGGDITRMTGRRGAPRSGGGAGGFGGGASGGGLGAGGLGSDGRAEQASHGSNDEVGHASTDAAGTAHDDPPPANPPHAPNEIDTPDDIDTPDETETPEEHSPPSAPDYPLPPQYDDHSNNDPPPVFHEPPKQVHAVPEPEALSLLAIGGLALAVLLRRRRFNRRLGVAGLARGGLRSRPPE
jgi:hypothetical protein